MIRLRKKNLLTLRRSQTYKAPELPQRPLTEGEAFRLYTEERKQRHETERENREQRAQ